MGFAIIYLILCIICGLLGKQTRAGIAGVFLLSFFLTPFTTLVYLLFLKEPKPRNNPGPGTPQA